MPFSTNCKILPRSSSCNEELESLADLDELLDPLRMTIGVATGKSMSPTSIVFIGQEVA